MENPTTTDQSASPAKSKPKSSADRTQSSKRKPTKKPGRRDSAKLKPSPKKTDLTKKSKSSLAQSKNLPPSAYMRPVITGTNENGEGGAVEWVNVGIKPEPIRTMAERVETRMLIIIAGGQSKGDRSELQAAYRSQLAQMREALGAGDDPLETLLIERIVLTWARLQYVEEQAFYSYLPNHSNPATAEYWDRRLTDAHSRFLKSCTALARVRKLRQRSNTIGASAAAAILKNSLSSDWSASDALRNVLARRKGK